MSDKPAPFTDSRNKLTIYKITVIYAAFYVLMKVYSIVVESLWVLPNLIISLPVVIVGIVAWWHLKKNKTFWWFIIISIIVVSAVRYFEADWVVWLNQNL
ncbi:hypothetical protein [Mesohalobacter halotolerans]|jgi:hypothetical protein|uniref:Uncharacterized protein n=1 Tax=Mesohalobacter halotolerans TaxID=1883405 RepID=A0A4U5TNQ0_9FLAO|nr:hypothetical protein [Mesohalobacter halotolerans]MBS3739026.1 hypothetical protein [Psychroflexus sp.]NBC57559.1 hypothetical protein [Bacteroidota bacterium]TKS55483.1 hypothetical protein FCN74_11055 [Mesohalobacter halotolerans]